jgi:hypothetical protein
MRRIVLILMASIIVLTGFLFSYVPADACHVGCYTPCHGCYSEDARMRGAASGAFSLQGTPPPGTPTPAELCDLGPLDFEGATKQFLGFAHREPEEGLGQNNVPVDNVPDIPLCEFQVLLAPGLSPASFSDSLVDSGEAAVFHVSQGAIDFCNDTAEEANGFLRVHLNDDPNDGDDVTNLDPLDDGTDTFLAEPGDIFTLSDGGSIYLDNQPERVALIYQYAGGGLSWDGEACNPGDVVTGEEDAELLIVSSPPEGGDQE